MKSIILCEGFDDQYILGYYLYNRTKENSSYWDRMKDSSEFSSYLNMNNLNAECYKRNENYIAIIKAKGKDNLKNTFKKLSPVIKAYPDEITNIVFVMDRDDSSIETSLSEINSIVNSSLCNVIIPELTNNSINTISYEDDNDETSRLNIIPIIIPFDESGAIETILMNGIKSESEEDKFIVNRAETYITELTDSGKLEKHLQKRRLILKAKFASIIAVTNPDRSTSTYDKLLSSHNWFEYESVKRHFEILINAL